MKSVNVNSQLNQTNLWNGCILVSIAHAIMVSHYPELSYEHSWDGDNYSVVNDEGARGTVSFKSDYFVAAFRNEHFPRTDMLVAIDFLKGAPKEVIQLASDETFEYLLEEDEDGRVSPAITTAFWGDKHSIISIDNIIRIVQGGGYLLERQLMDSDSAIQAWRDYYEMTSEQVELLKSIYDRKVSNPNERIILTKSEIEMIGTAIPEGLRESQISFEEIGIYLET